LGEPPGFVSERTLLMGVMRRMMWGRVGLEKKKEILRNHLMTRKNK
jgi:hypothetical protein